MAKDSDEKPKLDSNTNYLSDLLQKVKVAYENNKELPFKIIATKEKGFSIKVGGLFGYVPYNYMPWKYRLIEYWGNVGQYLINEIFVGKIYKLEEDPILILVDASGKHFKEVELVEFEKYRGVVVSKTKYGLFIDIGLHFNWEYGSLLGLMHKSSLLDISSYEDAREGEEIWATFMGYSTKGELNFGEDKERKKWMTKELHELVGTIQKVSVVVNKEGKKEFYVQSKHKAWIRKAQSNYPDIEISVKELVGKLKHGQIIDCLVVKINNRRDHFILKLIPENLDYESLD